MDLKLSRYPDSPIESLLLDAMIAYMLPIANVSVIYDWVKSEAAGSMNPDDRAWKSGSRFQFRIDIDATIDGYKPDAIIRLIDIPTEVEILFIVECDGHEFHERTQQQASYDRARDRHFLEKRGISTVRFTGSDIYRDANQCAREVYNIARSMLAHLSDAIIEIDRWKAAV